MKRKKNTWFRNLVAVVAKVERRWYQFKLDPKNAEIVNRIESQNNNLFN